MNEFRYTAYRYSLDHGLPCDLDSLLALGLAAARHGRWLGILECKTWEGPPGAQFPVHTWPGYVFAYVTGTGCPGCGWRLPPGARLCESCDDAWGGQEPPVSYAAWLEEGRVPVRTADAGRGGGAAGWDGDDIRPG